MRNISKRSGFKFPAGKFYQHMRTGGDKRINCQPEAAIFVTATIEYLVKNLLMWAGNVAYVVEAKVIEPLHLQIIIRGDQSLYNLFNHIMIK